VDLSGAAITQDKDETRLLYGKFVPFADILEGKVEPTASSEPFLAAVRKYSAQSKSSKNQQDSGTLSAAR
jgi:lipid-binding SYLF domain-containing protein